MISVKLRQQVPCLVDKGKLLGVSCKHDFLDVTGEELLLLCLANMQVALKMLLILFLIGL